MTIPSTVIPSLDRPLGRKREDVSPPTAVSVIVNSSPLGGWSLAPSTPLEQEASHCNSKHKSAAT